MQIHAITAEREVEDENSYELSLYLPCYPIIPKLLAQGHTSKGGKDGLLDADAADGVTTPLLGDALSYASDVDLRRLRLHSRRPLPPKKGDNGGVPLAGDSGGVAAGLPAGLLIIILRVTRGVSSDESSPPPSLPFPIAAVSFTEVSIRGGTKANLRSLPRPDSGRGPATVSSQSLSRRPMVSRLT